MDEDAFFEPAPSKIDIVQIAECVGQLALLLEATEDVRARRFLMKTMDALTYYLNPPRGELVVLQREQP
jgi:hypothetical protein